MKREDWTSHVQITTRDELEDMWPCFASVAMKLKVKRAKKVAPAFQRRHNFNIDFPISTWSHFALQIGPE